MRPIKILLADDHPVVREGLRSCLRSRPHLTVVGEAADGLEAVALAKRLAPDLVLMDISMPRMNGLKATEHIRDECSKVKVLILTVHDNNQYIKRMIAAGARGYVLKDTPPETLVQAIEAVHAGDGFFSPQVAGALVRDWQQDSRTLTLRPTVELSQRERAALKLLAAGLTAKEAAISLGVGHRTVETYRWRLMRKLKIHSVVGLTRYAVARGLIRVDP
jgi:DNA-binding NarL/FixJ family response regulator